MDQELENKLTELKKCITVPDGTDPMTKPLDAIRLAKENNLLYAWAQNGANYQLRWTEFHSPITVHETEVCVRIVEQIIQVVNPPEPEEKPVSEEPVVRKKKPVTRRKKAE